MKNFAKTLAIVALTLTTTQQFALATDRHLDPVSGPHYQLIEPAKGNQPARYRYFANGDNPQFGTQVYSETTTPGYQSQTQLGSSNDQARRGACLFAPCTTAGKVGAAIGAGIAQAIWSRRY